MWRPPLLPPACIDYMGKGWVSEMGRMIRTIVMACGAIDRSIRPKIGPRQTAFGIRTIQTKGPPKHFGKKFTFWEEIVRRALGI